MSKIVLFGTVKDCIKADKLLQQHDYKYRVIAIPASISSDCGMCIELNEDTQQIGQFLTDNSLTFDVYDY